MAFFECLLVSDVCQLLFGAHVVRSNEIARNRRVLTQWKEGPVERPQLDSIVRWAGGRPNEEAMAFAAKQAGFLQFIASQKAFQYVLAGLMTPGSHIYRLAPQQLRASVERWVEAQKRFTKIQNGVKVTRKALCL